ncbi:MAG: DUF2007 domain-containing protein [Myxococcales bacterium]|nr:DUF2007 domain-containing protein [Myxococcales bacterium]
MSRTGEDGGWIILLETHDRIEAGQIASYLESASVPVLLHDGDRTAAALYSPLLSVVQVAVHASRLERAKELLKQFQSQADIPESELPWELREGLEEERRTGAVSVAEELQLDGKLSTEAPGQDSEEDS